MMEYEFVPSEAPTRHIVGVLYTGNGAEGEIGRLWGANDALLKSVPNRKGFFGVSRMREGLPVGHFDYLAGVEVGPADEVPPGLTLWTVSGGPVYRAWATIDQLRGTIDAFYHRFLPASGAEADNRGLVEAYPDDFEMSMPVALEFPVMASL